MWLSCFCPGLPIPVQKQDTIIWPLRYLIHSCLKRTLDGGCWGTTQKPHKARGRWSNRATELLVHSFHCLKTNVKGQQSCQTHIRSCYKTSGGKTEHSRWGLTYVPNSSPMTVSAIPEILPTSQTHMVHMRTYACIWITYTVLCSVYVSKKRAEDNLQGNTAPFPRCLSHRLSHSR